MLFHLSKKIHCLEVEVQADYQTKDLKKYNAQLDVFHLVELCVMEIDILNMRPNLQRSNFNCLDYRSKRYCQNIFKKPPHCRGIELLLET